LELRWKRKDLAFHVTSAVGPVLKVDDNDLVDDIVRILRAMHGSSIV
jgi:hypothetical protein